MHKFSLILALMFTTLSIFSCGGGSDGSDGADAPVPQEEEDTGGGTTGGSGGSSGGSGGGTACLSTNQKQNISNLFNRLADISQVIGLATQSFRNPGETTTITDLAGGYIFTKESDSSWTVYGAFCDEFNQCFETFSVASFRNGCFFVDAEQARILSSSSNSLRVSVVTPDGSRDESSVSISSSDKVRTRESISQDGVPNYVFEFEEE